MARQRRKRVTGSGDKTDGCDLDFQGDPTADADLPPAAGGVQRPAPSASDPDHTDGCDLHFDEGALTPDEALPAASGGVA